MMEIIIRDLFFCYKLTCSNSIRRLCNRSISSSFKIITNSQSSALLLCNNSIRRSSDSTESGALVKIHDFTDCNKDLIIYNSYLNRFGFIEKKIYEKRLEKRNKKKDSGRPTSVFLNQMFVENNNETTEDDGIKSFENVESIKFPYSIKVTAEDQVIKADQLFQEKSVLSLSAEEEEENSFIREEPSYANMKINKRWMNDYEQYTYENEEIESEKFEHWHLDYGTADENRPVSKVPCGGCGAFIHCQDPAIPGYLPSEIFLRCKGKDLLSITCQRCHFMTNYNTALAVSVDTMLYPKLMAKIKNENALVTLMVDLTDFPCSIWPGILHIIGDLNYNLELLGYKRPIFVVGNKIDLLWPDTKSWMENITTLLKSSFPPYANIKHVGLISAKTGFGVEELINKLHNYWNYKGDVYLIGCTNVGKSTLFNALLQSDYCKVKAVDLMQRATTSPWPGTTLNLLKFPILRPEGWRLYLRTLRLMEDRRKANYERKMMAELKKSRKEKDTGLQIIGHVGRTFQRNPNETDINSRDNFSAPNKYQIANSPMAGSGLDPNDPDFVKSKWFYDTPGVVHTDQILDLLTTEELMLTLPKTQIKPRTFLIKPGWSLFIAGLARLDYSEGDSPIRISVFASSKLPITICSEINADEVYKNLLGSKYFQVPQFSESRLKQWPNLSKVKEISLLGINYFTSCADIVLSSAGWISITPNTKQICKFIPWTPFGRGVHVRSPSLLPNAVNLRGKKHSHTPAYGLSKPFLGR